MSRSFIFIGVPEAGMALSGNLIDAGFKVSTDIASADIIFTLCARQSQLEDVCYEAEGIISNALAGSYLVNLGAATPTFARELSTMATVNDIHFVESPLVVRDCTAANAYVDPQNLIALMAGEDDDVEEMEPVVSSLAGSIQRCGASGQGQLVKCSLTMQQCAQLAAFAEADALAAVGSNHDATALVSRIALDNQLVSPGTSHLYEAVSHKDFGKEHPYDIEVIWGELEAALDAAEESQLIIPQAESALYLLELLATIGGISMSPASLRLIYSPEDEVSAQGLDWKRAEEAYDFADHHHHDDCSEDDYDGEDDYLGLDDDGLGGGFGEWSSN